MAHMAQAVFRDGLRGDDGVRGSSAGNGALRYASSGADRLLDFLEHLPAHFRIVRGGARGTAAAPELDAVRREHLVPVEQLAHARARRGGCAGGAASRRCCARQVPRIAWMNGPDAQSPPANTPVRDGERSRDRRRMQFQRSNAMPSALRSASAHLLARSRRWACRTSAPACCPARLDAAAALRVGLR